MKNVFNLGDKIKVIGNNVIGNIIQIEYENDSYVYVIEGVDDKYYLCYEKEIYLI